MNIKFKKDPPGHLAIIHRRLIMVVRRRGLDGRVIDGVLLLLDASHDGERKELPFLGLARTGVYVYLKTDTDLATVS